VGAEHPNGPVSIGLSSPSSTSCAQMQSTGRRRCIYDRGKPAAIWPHVREIAQSLAPAIRSSVCARYGIATWRATGLLFFESERASLPRWNARVDSWRLSVSYGVMSYPPGNAPRNWYSIRARGPAARHSWRWLSPRRVLIVQRPSVRLAASLAVCRLVNDFLVA